MLYYGNNSRIERHTQYTMKYIVYEPRTHEGEESGGEEET